MKTVLDWGKEFIPVITDPVCYTNVHAHEYHQNVTGPSTTSNITSNVYMYYTSMWSLLAGLQGRGEDEHLVM